VAQEANPKIKLNLFGGTEAGFDLVVNRPDLSVIRTAKQVHGIEGYRVMDGEQSLPEADWLWTSDLNVRLGVMVADCTAALMLGTSRVYGEVISAAHAGWRGTAKGIWKTLVNNLQLESFKVWLSPSICAEHFEVGIEVLESLGEGSRRFARAKLSNKFDLDLKAFQIEELRSLGGDVSWSSLCTYCQSEFVSYRKYHGQIASRHLAWIKRV
jgi:hypothetical protein